MVEEAILCKECNQETLTKSGKSWRKVNSQRVRVQNYRCSNCGYIGVLVRENGSIVYKVIEQ